MNGELLRRIVRSFRVRDDDSFVKTVRQLIQSERRQGHHRLAGDLDRLLNNGATPVRRTEAPQASDGSTPRSKAEGAPLLDIRRSAKSMADIILELECRGRLLRFFSEFSKQEALAEHGLTAARKLLFFGPPGNGKTLCAEVIACELDLPLFYVRFDAVVGSYLGETAANLRRVFDYAAAGLGVLFFDEVDAIGKSRGDRHEIGELKRVVNSFLQLLDGYQGQSPVIAATNYETVLDYAVWRRFDDVLCFPQATQEQLIEYLSRRLAPFPLEGFSPPKAAEWCEGMSFADVAKIATYAIKTMAITGASVITAQMVREAAELHRRTEEQRPAVRADN